MHAKLITIAALAAFAAAPALAQVSQTNPNAANESLARQGESRALQQNITSQNNTTRMDIQRSQQAQPVPQTGPGVIVAPRR
ncbi:hypothetical protein [uncultured Methylobacterium sp.]|uniref:hypothetical protein n=1 Tax=uncultured Methylobacterium sp. TaxID=157278 RepID=UPI0035CAECA2